MLRFDSSIDYLFPKRLIPKFIFFQVSCDINVVNVTELIVWGSILKMSNVLCINMCASDDRKYMANNVEVQV